MKAGEPGDGRLFELVDLAAFAQGLDEEVQLFGGVSTGVGGGAEAEEAGDDGSGLFDHIDQRPEGAGDEEQDGGDDDGEAVGTVEGEVFGDDFADEDVQVAHQDEAQGEAEAMDDGVGTGG